MRARTHHSQASPVRFLASVQHGAETSGRAAHPPTPFPDAPPHAILTAKNIRLQSLLAEAQSRLAEADQSRLADLVEAFVATRNAPADFSPEEQAHLARLDAEPFDAADPAEVADTFRRRG